MEPVAGTDARTGQRRSFTQEFDDLQQQRLAAAEIGMNELKRGGRGRCDLRTQKKCFCAGERGAGADSKNRGPYVCDTYR